MSTRGVGFAPLFIFIIVGWALFACEPSPAIEPSRPAPLASRPRIVVLGDSLTAGLGLASGESFPARLQERLERERVDFEVMNSGVSGDTSAGGLRRIDWVLGDEVRILIVAIGGNDGLRGLPVSEMKSNLARIIERAGSRGITVLLAGMEAPPNLGTAYTSAFRQVFRDLAREHQVALMPFLLKDVAGVAALNQPDGIHPNAEGARRVAENLWGHLRPLVEARLAR